MPRSLCLVALVLLAAGCDSSGAGSEPVAGDLVVSLGVDFETGGVLRLVTEEVYPCLGYSLVLGVEASEQAVRVNVEGVRGPESVCATALGPAVGEVDLDLTLGESIRVEIRHRGGVDEYDVENDGATGRIVAVRTSTTRLAE